MTRSTRLDDDEQWLVGIGAQVHPGTDDEDDSDDLDGAQLDEDGVDLVDDAGDDDHDGDADEVADSPDDPAAVEPAEEPSPAEDDKARRRRFTPWVLGVGVAAAVLATVITAVASGLNSPASAPAAVAPSTSSKPSVPRSPQPPPPSVDTNGDGPLPFTATSDCDEAGSTAAQSIAVPDSPTPWICVLHGPGQLLDLVLGPPGMPQSYVITGVVIVPGAIGRPGRPDTEPDPWLAHQVVTRLQWSFNDPASTVKQQNTYNVRGEAPMAIPRITASRVTVMIQETSLPPVSQPTSTAEAAPGGVFGSVLGPQAPSGGSGPAFPVDSSDRQADNNLRTFAVSSIKIIGHKAI